MTCQCTHTAQEKAILTGEESLLDNHGSYVVTQGGDKQNKWDNKRRNNRKERYRRLQIAKSLSPDDIDLCFCRAARIKDRDVSICLSESDDGKKFASYEGLQKCKKIHKCPVCAAKQRHGRAVELDTVMKGWILDGNSVAFTTLTMPHTAGDKLTDLLQFFATKTKPEWWDNGKYFIRELNQERQFRKLKKELAIKGYCRVIEMPRGINGWHVHGHILWFFEGIIADKDLKRFHARIFKNWSNHLKKYHRAAPLSTYVKTDLVNPKDTELVSNYLLKVSLEMTRTDLKATKSEVGGITPFELLDMYDLACTLSVDKNTGEVDLEREAEAHDLKMAWYEYVNATHGLQVIRIPPSLKKRYCVEEKTDDQLVEEEAMGRILAKVPLTEEELRAVVYFRRQTYLLNIMEVAGPRALRLELDKILHYYRRIKETQRRKQGALFPPKAQ